MYEYAVRELPKKIGILEEQEHLEKMAKNGWELLSVVQGSLSLKYYWKKRILTAI